MSASDKEQKGVDVRYHARMAMGEKLDGTSLQSKGASQTSKSKGGLSSTKKK